MNARTALFAFILVLGVIVTGLALASREPPALRPSHVAARELPREWVWKKQTIRFDDMYRR